MALTILAAVVIVLIWGVILALFIEATRQAKKARAEALATRELPYVISAKSTP